MELTLLPLLLSAIQHDFDLHLVEVMWVFNAYAVAVAIAVLCVAAIGDTTDKRKLFIVGVSIFSVGSMLCAISNDLGSLTLSRLVQGFGGGLFFPLAPVLLTQANLDHSGRILMLWGALTGFVAAVLPLFGAAILAGFGLPSVFLTMATVAVIGLIFVIVEKPAGTIPRQRSGRDFKLLFTNRGVWLLLSYIFLTYGCFSFYLFHFAFHWRQSGLTSNSVSVFLMCVWIAFSVVSLLLRDKVDGKGLNRALIFAPALLAFGFAVAFIDVSNPTLQILSAVCVGAGLGCCNSTSTHLLLRKVPSGLQAFSSCLDIVFARIGGAATVGFFTLTHAPPVLLTICVMSVFAIYAARLFLRNFLLGEKCAGVG